PLLERVLEEAERAGCLAEQALSVTWLSEAYLLAGHREEVRASTTRALARTQQERGHEAWALRLLGEMAAQCQPLGVEPAAAPYREALALADALGMRPLQAHSHLSLGTLYGGPVSGAGPYRALHGDRDVSRHGDDVLAPAGGGGAGTRRGAIKARMVSRAETGCVSWDLSVGLRRSGRENHGNEPE